MPRREKGAFPVCERKSLPAHERSHPSAHAGKRRILCLMVLMLISGCGKVTHPIAVSDAATAIQQPLAANDAATAIQQPLAASDSPSPAQHPTDTRKESWPIPFTDARNRSVALPEPPHRVVSAYGSFAEAWSLAGGTLVGVTEDVRTDGRIVLTEDIGLIGSVKEPSAERIIDLEPDLVWLSADIESHVKLGELLQQAGVPHAFCHVETFTDYLALLEIMTTLTNKPDLYQVNGLAVAHRIDSLLASRSPAGVKVLLLRSHAKGAKALGEDTATGIMLKELGAFNIAQSASPLLKELSLESIIQSDPDLILITTMGSEEQAVAYLEEGLMKNPAWSGLKAAKTGNIQVLPKDLFQYKPNNRWDEAYADLATLLDASR